MTTTTGITTTILVRRLPGSACWELLVSGPNSKPRVSSPSPTAIALEAIAAVARAGGRAVVEYNDQDSMQDRARRRKLNQKTANTVYGGDRFHVRFSNHHNAYVPCSDKAPTCEVFTVYSVEFRDDQGMYVFKDANAATVRWTRPFAPHEIIQLIAEA